MTSYRPLPAHSGLGLSAFYIALLTTMCGFLGATIINGGVDAALGYATSEVGPWWRQRRPLRITRWQTLLTKWLMAFAIAPLLTAVMLAVAAGILRMDVPHLVMLDRRGLDRMPPDLLEYVNRSASEFAGRTKEPFTEPEQT